MDAVDEGRIDEVLCSMGMESLGVFLFVPCLKSSSVTRVEYQH